MIDKECKNFRWDVDWYFCKFENKEINPYECKKCPNFDKDIKVKGKITKVSIANEKIIDKHDMFIEKLFYDYEIDLLIKMCVECLNNDKFNDDEKLMIDSILENTLV